MMQSHSRFMMQNHSRTSSTLVLLLAYSFLLRHHLRQRYMINNFYMFP
eukprot:SAG31_NODE_977_length_10615_cov_93.546786_8_plen_48_part_00